MSISYTDENNARIIVVAHPDESLEEAGSFAKSFLRGAAAAWSVDVYEADPSYYDLFFAWDVFREDPEEYREEHGRKMPPKIPAGEMPMERKPGLRLKLQGGTLRATKAPAMSYSAWRKVYDSHAQA